MQYIHMHILFFKSSRLPTTYRYHQTLRREGLRSTFFFNLKEIDFNNFVLSLLIQFLLFF